MRWVRSLPSLHKEAVSSILSGCGPHVRASIINVEPSFGTNAAKGILPEGPRSLTSGTKRRPYNRGRLLVWVLRRGRSWYGPGEKSGSMP